MTPYDQGRRDAQAKYTDAMKLVDRFRDEARAKGYNFFALAAKGDDWSKVSAYSYVPADALDDVLTNGLHSGKSLLTDPERLAAAAKGRGVSPEEFKRGIEEKLKSWKGYAVSGPNVLAHRIPEGLALSDKHPTRTSKLAPVQIDVERLLREMPETKLYGMELKPYQKGVTKPGERHGYVDGQKLKELYGMTPEQYWSTYSDPTNEGYYAPDVPHLAVHTPSGHIPAKFLKKAAYHDNPKKVGPHTWTGPDGTVYDVKKLWGLAKDNPVEEVDFQRYVGKKVHGLLAKELGDEHEQRVQDADLSYPLLVSPENDRVDGTHRIAKAIRQGLTKLPAQRLTAEQMAQAVLENNKTAGEKIAVVARNVKQLRRAKALLAPHLRGEAPETVPLFHNMRDRGADVTRNPALPVLQAGELRPSNANNLHRRDARVYLSEGAPYEYPSARPGMLVLPGGRERAPTAERMPTGVPADAPATSPRVWPLSPDPVPLRPKDTLVGGVGLRGEEAWTPEQKMFGEQLEQLMRERRLRHIPAGTFSQAMFEMQPKTSEELRRSHEGKLDYVKKAGELEKTALSARQAKRIAAALRQQSAPTPGHAGTAKLIDALSGHYDPSLSTEEALKTLKNLQLGFDAYPNPSIEFRRNSLLRGDGVVPSAKSYAASAEKAQAQALSGRHGVKKKPVQIVDVNEGSPVGDSTPFYSSHPGTRPSEYSYRGWTPGERAEFAGSEPRWVTGSPAVARTYGNQIDVYQFPSDAPLSKVGPYHPKMSKDTRGVLPGDLPPRKGYPFYERVVSHEMLEPSLVAGYKKLPMSGDLYQHVRGVKNPLSLPAAAPNGQGLLSRLRQFIRDNKNPIGLPATSVKTSEELRRSHAPRTGPDKLKIKTVDGTKVRDNIDTDFTMGGNPSRYSYIPKGEMWVEKNLSKKDRVSTVIHEAIEHRLMKNKGMSYEKAHDEANKSDPKVRRLYEKAKKQPLLYDHVKQGYALGQVDALAAFTAGT